MSATRTDDSLPEPPAAGLELALPPRRCGAGEGWTWIAEGWKLFAKAPLMWIVAILLVIVLAIIVSLVPFIGSLAVQVLNAAIGAGFMVACRSLETGGDFELEHLFAGFKRHFGGLVAVGLITLAGSIAILVACAGIVGFSILGAALSGDAHDVAAAVMSSAMSIVLAGLLALALMVPLFAAYWFAPALVIMHGLGPVEAMKESFVGCMRNLVPFLVYGIVMALFAIIAAIPFGLGYLVWVPVTIASTYASYRGIFTRDAAPSPATAMVA